MAKIDLTPKRRPVLWGMAVLLILLGSAWWVLRPTAAPAMAAHRVTMAVPTQISSALPLVAFHQDLFRKAGVEVINQPFLLGKDALKSVLDGKADLAVVADVPFMYALLGGHDLAMLAGISQSRRSLAIVARKDRGITQIQDLRGKSVALTKGANFHYFLDAMLSINKIPASEVKLVDLPTPAVIEAFKSGKIDAAAVFQPFLAQLQQTMPEQMQVFFGEDIYAFRFLLVGKPAFIDAHPQEIERVLAALVAAQKTITEQPDSARSMVGKVVGVDDTTMANLFNASDYALTLDQAMLLALDDQTRWAMQNGLVQPGPVPNFIQFMIYRHLEAVLPSAVKIVR